MTTANNDPTHLAWAAGFFEGEGSVDIKRRPNNNFLIRTSATNCVSAYLYRLSFLFGGNVYPKNSIDKRAKSQKRHRWCWEIGANKAYLFLEAILPYMTEAGKIEEVKLAMKFQEELIGVDLTPDVLEKREELWSKIRELRHEDDVPVKELMNVNT